MSHENSDKLSTPKEKWYIVYKIPKRSGGFRKIEEPVPWLKDIQTDIYKDILLSNYRLSPYSYGSVKKRGIVHASTMHLNSKKILRIDIKDFFPSITKSMIETALLENKDMNNRVASYIAELCTNHENILPQGGVTSPSLANIVTKSMCNAIGAVAERMGCKFTAYLDDLIVSGDTPEKMIPIITRIINSNGFDINKKKTAVMQSKQEVLGICVRNTESHTRLPKRFRNRIRGMLHRFYFRAKDKKLSNKAHMHITGLVNFSIMVGDQKASVFKKKLEEINSLLKKKKE